MTEHTSVADGLVVSIHYTLTLDDGSQVDTSRDKEPLQYLHGAQNIVPGLERQLTGKSVGEKVDATVAAEEGYGPRFPDAIQEVPKEQIPEGVEVGMQLQAETPDGQHVILHVQEIRDDVVVVDLNHPLAGETLNFAVEIMAIRAATDEERDHGHPHGPGGHPH